MTPGNIIGLILVAIGGYFSVLSWGVLIRWLRNGKHTSWPPFLFGSILAFGLALTPWPLLNQRWWLAFLIDYGSAPGVFLGIGFHLWRFLNGKETRSQKSGKQSDQGRS